MAASDHLSSAQFFHGSPHQFMPGDELTREGAWRANHPHQVAELDAAKRDIGGGETFYSPKGNSPLRMYPSNNDGHPVEDHLYYGDRSFFGSGEAAGYGGKNGGAGHVYAVEPLTAAGRKPKSHQADPNYTSEGMSGAYRTKGKLRVLHEVDHEGNPL